MSVIPAPNVVVSVIYILLMVISIPCNSLILWVISTHNALQTPTNLLVCNLSLAGLLATILRVPFIIYELLNPLTSYPFSQSMCQFQALISTSCTLCISITLTTVCVDRFNAIVYPMKFNLKLTRNKSLLVIFCSWIASLACFAPYASFNVLYPISGKTHCLPFWPESSFDIILSRNSTGARLVYIELSKFLTWLFLNLMAFVIPTLIMATLYSITVRRLWFSTDPSDTADSRQNSHHASYDNKRLKQKQQVIKILMTCCAVFIAFNSPYYVLFMLLDFHLISIPSDPRRILLMVLKLINYCSIAYNPIIYGYQNSGIRRHAPQWLQKVCFRIRHPTKSANGQKPPKTALSRSAISEYYRKDRKPYSKAKYKIDSNSS